MTVLVTGATGFIGSALVSHLAARGEHAVRAAVHSRPAALPTGVAEVRGDLSADADWRPALKGVEMVVHLAARVHVMRERSADPLAAFRRVNVDGTITLARQAIASGVQRFVYLSSVKVNGESGVFTEADPPAPGDPYGISKCEAEHALREASRGTRMQVVILRPPLVYGPGVGANFRALMRAVARGVPLPLGAVHNRRSLIGVDNLCDVIATCLTHPAAGGETFLVSDGEDLSTADLVRRLARALHRSPRLLAVPPSMLMAAATLAGQREVARRLLDTLQVDIGKARRVLSWTPPVPVDVGFERAAAGFRP